MWNQGQRSNSVGDDIVRFLLVTACISYARRYVRPTLTE